MVAASNLPSRALKAHSGQDARSALRSRRVSEGTTSTFSSSSSRSLIVDVITTNHEPSEPQARFAEGKRFFARIKSSPRRARVACPSRSRERTCTERVLCAHRARERRARTSTDRCARAGPFPRESQGRPRASRAGVHRGVVGRSRRRKTPWDRQLKSFRAICRLESAARWCYRR